MHHHSLHFNSTSISNHLSFPSQHSYETTLCLMHSLYPLLSSLCILRVGFGTQSLLSYLFSYTTHPYILLVFLSYFSISTPSTKLHLCLKYLPQHFFFPFFLFGVLFLLCRLFGNLTCTGVTKKYPGHTVKLVNVRKSIQP